jgi:xanthine/CO dehydrogenase XdhC/CoxF family maturation factor
MGIEIGAVSAEEIGISVVAEMIRVRRGTTRPLTHKSEVMKELFRYLHVKRSGKII